MDANNKTGCLIIHGFAGNIEEVRPLAEFLSGHGFDVCCPALKGHTGKRKDLSRVHYREWVRSAEEEFNSLSERCGQVVVMGFSMGGLVAVNLAMKHKLKAMITLNTPIYHWDFNRIRLNILEDIKAGKQDSIKYYMDSSFGIPLSALISFKAFLESSKPLFRRVDCPLFVAQGMLDDTVQHRSANYIYNSSPAKIKQLEFYPNSRHRICLGPDREELFGDILEFVSGI